MVAREVACNDTRPKASSRVKTAAGVEYAYHFGNEKCKPNTNGCKESSLVFLSREHEYGDDQHRSQEHLHEDALSDRNALAEGGRNIQIAREHGRDNSCSGYACQHLRDEAENGAIGSEGTNEVET